MTTQCRSFRRSWTILAIRKVAIATVLLLLAPLGARAQSSAIGRSQDALPIARALMERLGLDSVQPAELIAGAESQFAFFFPAGLNSSIYSRTQLDALVASTLLLEEGLRKGAGSYRQARTLFECYFLMYQAGKAGLLGEVFEQLRQDATEGGSQEDREIINLYAQSIEAFEEYGRNYAESLGNILIVVRPEDTEIAYALAHIADLSGDQQRAVRLYQRGLSGEQYAERLLIFSELQAVAGLNASRDTQAVALSLQPELAEELEDYDQRVETRQAIARAEQGRGIAALPPSERAAMAWRLRQTGRLLEALDLYQGLSDWGEAPPELVEEHAMTAMEANQPHLMAELMASTRSRTDPSSRLLQLRLVADSLQLVSAAASTQGGIRLADYLDSQNGSQLRADLDAFAALDATRAQFVRVYLELVTALVTLRLTGSLDEPALDSIRSQVAELARDQPDNVAGQRFRLMLALYENDRPGIYDALEGYERYCGQHDCETEYRRTASMILLQLTAKEGDLSILDRLDRLLEEWPSRSQGTLYHLARGTRQLLGGRLGQTSQSELDRAYEQASRAFLDGIEAALVPDAADEATASDLAGLYNNLAFIALEQRDAVTAALYLSAARRVAPSHPIILLNLGVAYASSQNLEAAFVNFTLAGAEVMMEPTLTFQVLRWAGHLYNLAGRSQESAQTYQRALALYEAGEQWATTVDDGIYPGGAVEWGLLYDDSPGDEGLVVTLDMTTPPLFYVPAPVSLLEMSAALENVPPVVSP